MISRMARHHALPPLSEVYQRLREHFGHRNWWPGETPFEVMVGAILTQNTAWSNVEKAIRNLKANNALSIKGIREAREGELAEWIRPSGYFNQKARKLKALVAFIDETHGGSLARMRKVPLEELRAQLLRVNGIGPETADSILLYALDKPIFVVDAYTRRIFTRHFYLNGKPSYHAIQERFMRECPPDAEFYNDFHAQIVEAGKSYCRKRPLCAICPLEPLPHSAEQGA
ncbi:MAG: Endonuclease III [bacterium]|nr:Endonuclease III [bacterium]